MRFHVGTSGFSYPAWKGSFYPAKLPAKEMLSFYSRQFDTVEMNNTFYKLPEASVVESWRPQTPKTFRFALKAPQRITHIRRLKDAATETEEFFRIAALLKRQLGPLLFQLPPNFKKDLPRLEAFLKLIHRRAKIAFEFRHDSWFDDEVYACLRKHKSALCVADTEERPTTTIISTATWGYVRLRRTRYTAKQLKTWFETIASQSWTDVDIFFMHEETGTGPRFAKRFLELAGV